MREFINIVKEAGSEMSFKEEVRGSHSGQLDMTLACYVSGTRVGHIDYSIYHGEPHEPHVQMISVSVKRKGYGKALLKKLQSMFPNEEINLGYLTDQGQALINSLDFETIKNPRVIELRAKLKILTAKLADYLRKSEKLKNYDGDRDELIASLADWNDLHDEKEDIEDELRHLKPEKRLIKESDLPMDDASRMQRAKELGFTFKAYHGTGAKFNEFDLDKGKPNVNGGHAPYFANKKSEAKGYAKKTQGHVLEVLLRIKKPYYATNFDSVYNLYKNLANEQIHSLMKYPMPKSDNDEGWEEYHNDHRRVLDIVYQQDNRKRIWNEVYKKLRDDGYDSIIWKDVPADHTSGRYDKIIILDPKNVRLISAAFDPAQSESKDLRA